VLPGLHRYDEAANAAARRRGRVWLAAAAAVGVAALQYAGVRLDFLAIGIAVVGMVLTAVSVPRLLPPGTLRFRRGLPTW
jgi:hypothetical protein